MGTEELRARIFSAQKPLRVGQIHVWRTALSRLTPLADEMKAILSPDELGRSEKFRFPEHRLAFIAGRALLRMILGSYCSCEPHNLGFTYGDQAKPRMDEMRCRLSRTVSFNLSHSRHVLQIAVAAQGSLGIDIEDLSRDFDLDGLVAVCLTEEEALSLNSLPSTQRRNAFLRYWVHKEAFLKCVGTGFSVSPNEVHVSFGESGGSEMRCTNPMADVVLLGRDLATEPGHLAAIATAERDYDLQLIVL